MKAITMTTTTSSLQTRILQERTSSVERWSDTTTKTPIKVAILSRLQLTCLETSSALELDRLSTQLLKNQFRQNFASPSSSIQISNYIERRRSHLRSPTNQSRAVLSAQQSGYFCKFEWIRLCGNSNKHRYRLVHGCGQGRLTELSSTSDVYYTTIVAAVWVAT